ncbi:hypothetical protein AVEN_44183-1, partial [Araneus ventricosus]
MGKKHLTEQESKQSLLTKSERRGKRLRKYTYLPNHMVELKEGSAALKRWGVNSFDMSRIVIPSTKRKEVINSPISIRSEMLPFIKEIPVMLQRIDIAGNSSDCADNFEETPELGFSQRSFRVGDKSHGFTHKNTFLNVHSHHGQIKSLISSGNGDSATD